MHGDQVIYRRTQRGDAELMARRSDLGPALNSLLVLMDGRRTCGELKAVVSRLAVPASSIDMLVAGGYVAAVTFAKTPEASSGQAPSAHEQLMPTDIERRMRLYEQMIGAVKEHLGFKGFLYHLKVEKAVTLSDLGELIDPLGEAIAKAKGPDAAREFTKRMKLLVSA